jgi:hypothetical protein
MSHPESDLLSLVNLYAAYEESEFRLLVVADGSSSGQFMGQGQ